MMLDNSNKKSNFVTYKYTDVWGCLVLTARDVVCKHAVRQ